MRQPNARVGQPAEVGDIIITYQFMDVGQGDCTFIIMEEVGDPEKTEIAMVDFGIQPSTKFKVSADDAMTYLRDKISEISKNRKKAVPYLDHLFITHPDQDHYNRVPALVKEPKFNGYTTPLSIGRLTYGGASDKYGQMPEGYTPKNLIDFLRPFCAKVDVLADAQHSTIEKSVVKPFVHFMDETIFVYLLCSNYPKKTSPGKNQLSLCLMFEDDSASKVILMGDAEEPVEKEIVKNFGALEERTFLNSALLKLGHHGSVKGTQQAWINAVRPEAIAASGDFVWAHPYCATIERVANSKVLKADGLGGHYFCCGIKTGTDYKNNITDLGIFANLWYVTVADNQIMIPNGTTDEEIAEKSVTYGVQWAISYSNAQRRVLQTSTSNPKEPAPQIADDQMDDSDDDTLLRTGRRRAEIAGPGVEGWRR